jgi:hypothetical protein
MIPLRDIVYLSTCCGKDFGAENFLWKRVKKQGKSGVETGDFFVDLCG